MATSVDVVAITWKFRLVVTSSLDNQMITVVVDGVMAKIANLVYAILESKKIEVKVATSNQC